MLEIAKKTPPQSNIILPTELGKTKSISIVGEVVVIQTLIYFSKMHKRSGKIGGQEHNKVPNFLSIDAEIESLN